MQRLSLLTGARFFAAVAVLSFHLMALITGPKALELFCSYGRAGVSFFFVLSGFVLTYNYHDRFSQVTWSRYRSFLWARCVRIAPTSVLALVLITPLCLWLNSHALGAANGQVVSPSVAAESWLANLFLVQVFFPKIQFEQMYNAPAWSISCEVVFYLVFPFFIAGLTRLATSGKRSVIIGMFCWVAQTAVVITMLFLVRRSVGRAYESLPIDFYIHRMPFIRFGEFAVGCCSGLLFLQTRKRQLLSGNWLLGLGLLVAFLTLAIFGCFPFFSYTSFIVAFTPAFAIVIFALASEPTLLSSLLRHPIFMLLGEASYALYLLHWTAYLWIRSQYGVEAPGWYLSLAGAVCIAASVVFLLFVDVPIRRWLRGGRSPVSSIQYPELPGDHTAEVNHP